MRSGRGEIRRRKQRGQNIPCSLRALADLPSVSALYTKGKASVSLDRTAPVAAFSGRSSVDVETDLYESFTESARYALDVGDEVYGRADYGLVASDPDLLPLPQNNDFFYGISHLKLNGPNAQGVKASSALSKDVPSTKPSTIPTSAAQAIPPKSLWKTGKRALGI
jgi:hypothetical protein